MLDRDQLETFASVAEAHSFERAAELLNITCGAASQRIKALEESLTTVLLVREKPVVPTAAGEGSCGATSRRCACSRARR